MPTFSSSCEEFHFYSRHRWYLMFALRQVKKFVFSSLNSAHREMQPVITFYFCPSGTKFHRRNLGCHNMQHPERKKESEQMKTWAAYKYNVLISLGVRERWWYEKLRHLREAPVFYPQRVEKIRNPIVF